MQNAYHLNSPNSKNYRKFGKEALLSIKAKGKLVQPMAHHGIQPTDV